MLLEAAGLGGHLPSQQLACYFVYTARWVQAQNARQAHCQYQFLGAVPAPFSQRMEIHGSAQQDQWYLVAQLFTIRQAG